MATHSLFGGASPPHGWAVSVADDSAVRLASSFYATHTTWQVKRLRLYVPSTTGFASTITLGLWLTTGTAVPNLTTAPVAQVTVTPTAGWVEGTLSAPVSVTAPTVMWVGLVNTVTHYAYVTGATVGNGFVQAVDGSDIYLSEHVDTTGPFRSRYQYAVDQGTSSALYGIFDLVVDDGAPEVLGPVTGTATLTLSASASASEVYDRTGGAQLTLTASATVVEVYDVTARADLALTASADVLEVYDVTGTATLALTAHAVAVVVGDEPPDLPRCGTLEFVIPTSDLVFDVPTSTLEVIC